jgi:hypothetical protein
MNNIPYLKTWTLSLKRFCPLYSATWRAIAVGNPATPSDRKRAYGVYAALKIAWAAF